MPTLISRTLLSATAILLSGSAMAQGPAPTMLSFQTHASFFSAETKQPEPIDPQVFVKDADVVAAVGPQGIRHAAMLRPALIDTDPASTTLFNADGQPLGFTLGEWLAPKGEATVTAVGAVTATFTALRPNARYSVFENHFDQTPVGFTPLDGTGAGNSFTTDARGAGRISLQAPAPLTHANAILVIYDDDGQSHGTSRGTIGVDAQHQLIARPG